MFIHDAVLEILTCGDTQTDVCNLRLVTQKTGEADPTTELNEFETQFKVYTHTHTHSRYIRLSLPPINTYRICLSISRSSSTICACALRGVRLIYRMWYIIADCGSKYNTWSIPSASRRRSRRWRSSYTAGFKLKVIETAEECGNRAAGREHSVSDWLALIRAYRF